MSKPLVERPACGFFITLRIRATLGMLMSSVAAISRCLRATLRSVQSLLVRSREKDRLPSRDRSAARICSGGDSSGACVVSSNRSRTVTLKFQICEMDVRQLLRRRRHWPIPIHGPDEQAAMQRQRVFPFSADVNGSFGSPRPEQLKYLRFIYALQQRRLPCFAAAEHSHIAKIINTQRLISFFQLIDDCIVPM